MSYSHDQMLEKNQCIIFYYNQNVLKSATHSWFYKALWEWRKKSQMQPVDSNSLLSGNDINMKHQWRI